MTNNDGIVWETPLESSDYDDGIEHVPAALAQRPGDWARVGTKPTSPKAAVLVKRIKDGKGIWADGVYEAVQRKLNDEQVVYARFLRPREDVGERAPVED